MDILNCFCSICDTKCFNSCIQCPGDCICGICSCISSCFSGCNCACCGDICKAICSCPNCDSLFSGTCEICNNPFCNSIENTCLGNCSFLSRTEICSNWFQSLCTNTGDSILSCLGVWCCLPNRCLIIFGYNSNYSYGGGSKRKNRVNNKPKNKEIEIKEEPPIENKVMSIEVIEMQSRD